jgi:hypothetical protein
MLVAGWRTYHDLTSAGRRTLAQPGSKELVSLVTHRVTAEQEPSIEVLVNGQPVVTVRLKFSADFDVSALLAEITEGRLVAIHTGRCDISATLAVDNIDLASGQTRLELPGAIPVTPGIRLFPRRIIHPALASQADAGRAARATGSASGAEPDSCGVVEPIRNADWRMVEGDRSSVTAGAAGRRVVGGRRSSNPASRGLASCGLACRDTGCRCHSEEGRRLQTMVGTIVPGPWHKKGCGGHAGP